MGTPLAARVEQLLVLRQRYDNDPTHNARHPEWFECVWWDNKAYLIRDFMRKFSVLVPVHLLLNPKFELASWYNKKLLKAHNSLRKRMGQNAREYNMLQLLDWGPLTRMEYQLEDVARDLYSPLPDIKFHSDETHLYAIELNGQQILAGTYPALQWGSATTRDFKQVIPKPVVVVMDINGWPASALIDSGSLSDFMSVTLADQLKVNKVALTKPIVVQLAVQGSQSKVNYGAQVQLKYQSIGEQRYFDVINLQHYDLVLRTPFLFQHCMMVGLNPPRIKIGSVNPLPMKGPEVTMLESRAAAVVEDLEGACEYLRQLAKLLCAKASEMSLPPLRAINHTIPLIDENKIYPWRPSRCLEPLRPQWAEKQKSYLVSGRW
ncbi:hypothetical protein BDR04DRAFT_1180195 [Suillus decipiens]|nr:hypothetical protein BDR04DRAFT_1180195 [Suillus decipiens]